MKLTPEEIKRNSESLLRILNAKQKAKRKLALIRQTKNYKEDTIMLTKEDAIKIAKSIIPDIEERIWFISMDKPRRAVMFGGIPDNCWYITYSSYPKDSNIIANVGNAIFINKNSGEIIYNGFLNDEG